MEKMLAWVFAVVVCVCVCVRVYDVRASVCHSPVLYQNDCTDQTDFVYRFLLAHATLLLSKLGYLQK